jgi:hypothetical protein
VSLQVSILMVLSGHPDGCATSAAMQRDLAILAASGPEWSGRMRKLAERAPALDIFAEGFVRRDPSEWRLTETGRDFLMSIEAAIKIEGSPVKALLKAFAPSNVVALDERRQKPHRSMLDQSNGKSQQQIAGPSHANSDPRRGRNVATLSRRSDENRYIGRVFYRSYADSADK